MMTGIVLSSPSWKIMIIWIYEINKLKSAGVFARYRIIRCRFLGNFVESFKGGQVTYTAITIILTIPWISSFRSQAPAVSIGRVDRLGWDWQDFLRPLCLGLGPSGTVTSFCGGPAVFATYLFLIGWVVGPHLGGEPVLATLHGQDLFAKALPHWSLKLDAVKKAHWRRRCGNLVKGAHWRSAKGWRAQSEQHRQNHCEYHVMPKAIAHPTDSRLLEKSCQHLVKLAD